MHTSEVVNKKRGVLMSSGRRCRRVHEDTISTERMVWNGPTNSIFARHLFLKGESVMTLLFYYFLFCLPVKPASHNIWVKIIWIVRPIW